ncbi:DUF3987 domain-containing protein [Pseudomonas sp. FEN]|uniref:DUF3987 domain-containing protein n=1 Tax=Pseudomonas sp. FEN TaxID=2767468 RepID=UPI002966B532|nr:DUF3987 domain-containing protein [Pseudomonas sp. FEN]
MNMPCEPDNDPHGVTDIGNMPARDVPPLETYVVASNADFDSGIGHCENLPIPEHSNTPTKEPEPPADEPSAITDPGRLPADKQWTAEMLMAAATANGIATKKIYTSQKDTTRGGLNSVEILEPCPEPRPLLPELETAEPYPIEALPPLMRDAARAIAEHVQAPLALAAQCVIGAAVYLAQTRVNAPHIHNPDGMPCSLFTLTLADSGDRKSGCRALASKTIDEAEKKADSDHKKACAEMDSFAQGLKGKELAQHLAENPRPADPRTQFTDATFEPIAGAFIRGMSAACWDTDEGGQVLGGASLKADTRAATLGALTKAFDTGGVERTRSNGNAEGSGRAYHRRLSLNLLAQAVTVCDALADPLLRGQGFLPRFLFASPASIAGTRLLSAEQLGRKAYTDTRLQRYWARCEAIAATPQAIDHETGEVKPPVLQLTHEAEQDWLEFYNEVEGEQSALGKFANLRPFAGRAGEIVRRLAAVFACFEGKTEIDDKCMCRATAIVRHSLSEWRRYTDSAATDPLLQQAAALMEWLCDPKRAGDWQEFHRDKLGKSGPPTTRKSANARDRLLAVLAAHHHLLTTDGKHFSINLAVEAEDFEETAES